MSIRKKISWCFSINSLQNDEIWKSKSEQRNASFPLEVMWPKWNKQQILGQKWCSQEPQAHITSPFKHFYFFSFFFQSCRLEVSDIFWPSNFASSLLVRTGAVSFSSPGSGSSWTLKGCRRWRWPWWRHWSDRRWAQSRTTPWRCFWRDASLLPFLSAAIRLQPQSPPCSGWWRQAGQC